MTRLFWGRTASPRAVVRRDTILTLGHMQPEDDTRNFVTFGLTASVWMPGNLKKL